MKQSFRIYEKLSEEMKGQLQEEIITGKGHGKMVSRDMLKKKK